MIEKDQQPVTRNMLERAGYHNLTLTLVTSVIVLLVSLGLYHAPVGGEARLGVILGFWLMLMLCVNRSVRIVQRLAFRSPARWLRTVNDATRWVATAVLPLRLDDGIADGCVYVPSGIDAVKHLSAAYGQIELEQVS